MTFTGIKITLANIIADWILDGLQKLPPDVFERNFDEQFEYPIIAKVDVPNDLDISIIKDMDRLFSYPWYCVNYGNFKRYAFSHEEQLREFIYSFVENKNRSYPRISQIKFLDDFL